MHDTPITEKPERSLSKPVQLHGVLVRILETGVLLIGESGIGKSECALDLVRKGHQLVADDVVEIIPEDACLIGRALPLTFELLEIRGLGIINARELFGNHAVADSTSVELCVELRQWAEVERIGNVVQEHEIAGNVIPKFVLPVSSGRNLSTLVETAVRIFINRKSGSNAEEKLIAKHTALLNSIQ